MSEQRLIVLCTVPDQSSAEQIAGALVDERLAACVNILPGVTSVYSWQGKRETDREVVLIIKTRQGVYQNLEQRIVALHPYELPEIVAVPLVEGLAGYLGWIDEMTGTSK